MSTNFKVECRKMKENLHFQLRGDFDGTSAWELINFIKEEYDGQRGVFIETGSLGRVHEFGCSTFRCRFEHAKVPPGCVRIKGEKAVEMAPRGSLVVMEPSERSCRCDGNCAQCRCHQNKDKKTLNRA